MSCLGPNERDLNNAPIEWSSTRNSTVTALYDGKKTCSSLLTKVISDG